MRDPVKIKKHIHVLVDKIENEELLEIVYQLLHSKEAVREGEPTENLSSDQKKELYESFDESFDEGNLIDLDSSSDYLQRDSKPLI